MNVGHILKRSLRRFIKSNQKESPSESLIPSFFRRLNSWIGCEDRQTAAQEPSLITDDLPLVLPGFPRDLQSRMSKIIEEVKTSALSNHELLAIEDDLIEQVSTESLHFDTDVGLAQLERIALYTGLLRLAGRCRQRLHRSVRCQIQAEPSSLVDELVVDLHSISTYREYARSAGRPDHLVAEVISYMKLIDPIGKTQNTTEPVVKNGKYDGHYRSFVQGKEVAVVGPGVPTSENGEEIDSFEVIVVLGYIGRDRLPNQKVCGSKVDVSYYGDGNATRYRPLPAYGLALNELSFACFKSEDHKNCAPLAEHRKRLFFRPRHWFLGSPFMAQNAIYDLILHSPRCVKLFNTNLYCSSHPHHEFYRMAKPNEKLPRSLWVPVGPRGFGHHNLISNFRFSQGLYRTGALQADSDLKVVLEMGLDAFLAAVQHHQVIEPRSVWLAQR